MIFKITLTQIGVANTLPINYQYPLSAAIYKIVAKGDATYAQFLHEQGYGKGFKHFTFSDLKGKFKIQGDRIHLLNPQVTFQINFHLPEASRNFVEGLFRSEKIVLADSMSKVSFQIQSILSIRNPLDGKENNEIIQCTVRTISPIVIGTKTAQENYQFLAPDHDSYTEMIIQNWRNKIESCFDASIAQNAILNAKVVLYEKPFRSRLVTIKANTQEETKIRGFINFKLILTGEKKFVELLINSGVGIYNAQGMGCVEVIDK